MPGTVRKLSLTQAQVDGGPAGMSARSSAQGPFPLRAMAFCTAILLHCAFIPDAHSVGIELGANGHEEVSTPVPRYQTQDSIHARDYVVLPGGQVVFKAGGEVTLSPGFEAREGSEFTAATLGSAVSGTVTLNGIPSGGLTLTLSGTTSTGSAYMETAAPDGQGRYGFSAPQGSYTITASQGGHALRNGMSSVAVDNSGATVIANLQAASTQTPLVYYHHDVLGSTVLQTDESGAVVMRAAYQPFGDAQSLWSADTNSEKHLFTGKEYEETGLYNFGARFYNPAIGRFMSMDPASGAIGNPQTWNRYAYCLNNPYKFVDPNGMWDEEIHFFSEEYGGTLLWAQDSFGPASALFIAKACNDVDSFFGGKGPLPFIGDQSYHFNTGGGEWNTPGDSRIKRAREHLMKAISLGKEDPNGNYTRALKELGTGLHALQDAYAHMENIDGLVSYDYDGSYYAHDSPWYNGKENLADDPKFMPGRVGATEKATRAYLKRFIDAVYNAEEN
jgi:RHS repeat-associated protein